MRGDEEGQLSSYLAVIHTVGAAKTLLKSLHNPPRCMHHAIKDGLPLLAIYMPHIGAIG